MQLTIDRQARDALYDACRSDIEACSDLRIDRDGYRGQQTVRELHRILAFVVPLLDQFGWDPETDPEYFTVRLNTRRMRPFLRRHVADMQQTLEQGITTERELDENIEKYREHVPDKGVTEAAREREWRAIRAQVDADLEFLAAYRRLLDVLDVPQTDQADRLGREAVA